MSEGLGGMQVNVGLNSSEFKRGMANINQQLRVARSEFKNATSSLKDFGKGTDGLRAKADYLSKSVNLQQQKVDNLKEAYEKAKSETGENSKKTQQLAIEYNNAQAKLNNLQRELKDTNETLTIQASKWTKVGDTLKDAGSKMQNAGQKTSGIGKDLSMKVTAPILAVGTACSKMAMGFENGVAKVSTIADATKVPIGDLRKEILKLSNDTGIASAEIANNVYDAISAGQKTEDAVNFVSNSTKLAKAGFAEAGQSLDLLTTIMNSYELEAKEVGRVSDILINTQNLGKTTVGELSQSMGKVIPTAKAFGVNLEQVASGYAIMTAKGIKSAETTTYMASMFNELGKTGTKASDTVKEISGKSFQELIASGKSVGDVLAMMDEYAKKNNLSLADLFGSAEAGKASLILSANAGKDFNEMLESMNNTAGATDKAFDKVNNTASKKIEKSFNKLKNAGIKFGASLTPAIEKVAYAIGKLADKFDSLSPAQINLIVKIGLLVAAIAPLLLIVGKIITIGGTVLSVIGTISGAMAVVTTGAVAATPAIAGLATAFTILTGPVGIAIAGIAAVSIAGVALYKHFSKDAIPAVQLFGKETSESTKKAVGAYMKLDESVGQSLMNLKLRSKVVSKETADNLVENFNDMGVQIKEGIDKNFNESYDTMQKFFNNSSALNDAEEIKILEDMKVKNEAKKAETDKYTNEIKEILTKASNEKRALTEAEEQKISDIQQKMKVDAVNNLSETELESKAILERMKQQAGNLTTQQAVEVVKNSLKQKDKAVKNANEQYDETIKAIIKQRDESKTISAEQAEKLIQDATLTRDETIKRAEETHNGVIEQAKIQAGEHAKQVDWEKGQVKTKWQEMKDNISQKLTDIKSDINQKWTDIKTNISDKLQDIKANVLEKWTEIKELPGKKLEEMKVEVKEKLNDVKSFFKNLKIPEIKIPHVKLPHFNIKGKFSLAPPQAPSFGVDWYAKGGVFNRPSIIGVGEAGREAVMPLDRNTGWIDELASKLNNKGNGDGITLQIDKFVNNREQDVESLANELAFYMKQRQLSKGDA